MKRKHRNILIVIAYFVVLFLILPLQYYNIAAWPIIFCTICVSAVLVLSTALGKPPKNNGVIVIAWLAVFYLSVHYLIRITSFCAWKTFETQYVSRTDESDTLVLEGYSCFLTDTDTQLFEERKITEHLKWVIPFYSKKIDPTKWEIDRGNWRLKVIQQQKSKIIAP